MYQEQFVLMLGEMPLIHDWLSALIFRVEFGVRRAEIEAKVHIVELSQIFILIYDAILSDISHQYVRSILHWTLRIRF